MKQTVLNTTNVNGVRFLYYFAYASAVASGVFCVLLTFLLLSNYFAPYSQTKIDEMIAMQKRIENEIAAKIEAEKLKTSTASTPTETDADAKKDKEKTSDATSMNTEGEAGETGQRPNLDAGTASTISAREVSPYPFLNLPSDNPELNKLRDLLAANPQNKELREQIRDLDQQLRVEYFRRKEIARNGTPFLLFAAFGLVFFARIAAVLNRKLPVPQDKSKSSQQQATTLFAQCGLAATMLLGAVCAGIAIGISFSQPSSLDKFLAAKAAENVNSQNENTQEPQSPQMPSSTQISSSTQMPGNTQIVGNANPQSSTKEENSTLSGAGGVNTQTSLTALDSDTEMKLLQNYQEKFEKQWASFRGHDGSGITTCKDIPTKWDVTSGEGVLWKTPISLPGHSSPIIWEDKVFLTGADDKERKVYCFSAIDGKLIWEFDVPNIPGNGQQLIMGVNLNEDTGYAAPTPVSDGERVYAFFPTGDILGVDFDGKLVWHKNLGVPDNIYGLAASLTLYKDKVIVQYDQGTGKKPDESKLIAFSGVTGEIAWETPRTMMNSWPSPVVRKIENKYQILTGANPWMVSYDADTGKELWRCKAYNGTDTASSPTGYGTTVYAACSIAGITAINATGSGDLSKTDMQLWRDSSARPDAASPIATEKYVYSLGPAAFLQCIDLEKGEIIWELDLDDYATFYSSPSLAEGRLYMFDKNADGAKAYVIDPTKAVLDASGTALEEGREKELIIAVNPMEEPIFASPAFTDGKIIIRGEKFLYCLGK